MKWLTKGPCPNYHTISDFRKDKPTALKMLFKLFVSFLIDIDVISGEIIAINGTKSRVHNAKRIIAIRKILNEHSEIHEIILIFKKWILEINKDSTLLNKAVDF